MKTTNPKENPMALTDAGLIAYREAAESRARSLAREARAELHAERAANPVFRTWRLCLDCAEAPDSPRHQPGYRMERSPYDTPGHEYVAPPEPEPPADPEPESGPGTYEDHLRYLGHDPSGRACALAGRVLRGDDKPGIGECEACISDSVPPMVSEVDLSDDLTGTLLIDGTPYAVQRNAGSLHGVWFLVTGPRGGVAGLVPYIEQPSPGVLHLVAMTETGRDPHFAAGKRFIFVAGRLGYIR